MTTQESVKPLVDRILSTPLQFKKASNKIGDAGSAPSNDRRQEPSYIMIGNGGSNSGEHGSNNDSDDGREKGEFERVGKPKVQVPKSMAEAINMYTAGTSQGAHSSDNDQLLSDADVNATTGSGSSSGSSTEEEFHEAKEYVDVGRKEEVLELPEGLDEDLGMAVDLGESRSSGSSSDQEFKASDGELADDSGDEVSYVSETERAQLQEEAQDALLAENSVVQDDVRGNNDGDDELKHKLPLSQRSMTPPTTISDITDFYQVNENPNDTGSNGSSRVVKNWGPHLSILKPRGLLNHGVTCYTNAAVQAMVHIPAIQHYLFDILRGKFDDIISKDSVSYVLAETSKKMWLPQDKSKKKKPLSYHINPKKLIARLDDINCMMSEWQQEDSHEYFMSLMSRLQEDSVPKGHKLTESIIYDIFGGLLKQVVTCKSCGGISKTEQPFYDLSLHLKGKKRSSSLQQDSASNGLTNAKSNQSSDDKENSTLKSDKSNGADVSSNDDTPKVNGRRFSIEKSIRDFFNPELIRVDKEQKGYVCEKCHKTTNAVKHNSILRAPETLLIHLKKFRFNGTSSSKMKQAVTYPMFLDLTEYREANEGDHVIPIKYQLTTVVVHEGRSLSSGHYIVHCKQPDGSWATYDDEYINKITEREVLKEPNAYYLLYTRLTPKAIPTKTILNVNDLDIPSQATSSPSNDSSSSPVLNNRNKKWKKNKKRRFNRY